MMDKVFLAYYHDGFTDDYPKRLEVCSSKECAEKVIEEHKRTRDKDMEYKDDATWWIEELEIKHSPTLPTKVSE